MFKARKLMRITRFGSSSRRRPARAVLNSGFPGNPRRMQLHPLSQAENTRILSREARYSMRRARWYRLMRTGTITRISRIFCRQNCGTDSASRTDISIGFRSLVSCMASRRRCCMRVRRSGYRRGCSNGQGIPKSARWTSILT